MDGDGQRSPSPDGPNRLWFETTGGVAVALCHAPLQPGRFSFLPIRLPASTSSSVNMRRPIGLRAGGARSELFSSPACRPASDIFRLMGTQTPLRALAVSPNLSCSSASTSPTPTHGAEDEMWRQERTIVRRKRRAATHSRVSPTLRSRDSPMLVDERTAPMNVQRPSFEGMVHNATEAHAACEQTQAKRHRPE
jgi:hypothetical protein